MILVVCLVLLGFGLVVAEVFFPSAGALSVLAGLVLIASVLFGFQESTTTGWTALTAVLVGLPFIVWFAFRLFPKTPLGRRMISQGTSWTEEERAAVEHDLARFVGTEGITLSLLRPVGVARFDGQRLDVTTRGESIEANTPVRAIRFTSNQLQVEAILSSEPPSS